MSVPSSYYKIWYRRGGLFYFFSKNFFADLSVRVGKALFRISKFWLTRDVPTVISKLCEKHRECCSLTTRDAHMNENGPKRKPNYGIEEGGN